MQEKIHIDQSPVLEIDAILFFVCHGNTFFEKTSPSLG